MVSECEMDFVHPCHPLCPEVLAGFDLPFAKTTGAAKEPKSFSLCPRKARPLEDCVLRFPITARDVSLYHEVGFPGQNV